MKLTRTQVLLAIIFIAATSQGSWAKDQKEEWQPVSAEELAVKDCPGNPGCAAMILEREELNDNIHEYWSEHYRIKIFTDEGKKYADVEVPFVKDESRVSDVAARTIHPDGKIVDFSGEIFEKVVVKGKNTKVLVKAFTLPAVEAGSIIEYRYTKHWGSGQSLDTISPWVWAYLSALGTETATEWDVQDDLYTRHAHFTFRPIKARLMWTWNGFPAGVAPQNNGNTIELDVRDVPALKKEEHMPPRETLMARVNFFYIFGTYKNSDDKSTQWYWEDEGKSRGEFVEKFIGRHKEIQNAVDQLVSPGDPPDAKLRKIYERAQQIRNLSFERDKTEKEERHEKLKDNNSVADVLKHGYGTGFDISALFAAMARAAGFEAHLADVAPRSSRIFLEALLNWNQLSAEVVEVRVGSESRFFDPATKYCPYGHLPWMETDARGVRMEEEKGVFTTTTSPHSVDSVLAREATLQLDATGNLHGNLKVVYSGEEALNLRLDNRDEDETGRRKALEDEVKGWLPAGSSADLSNSPKWETSEDTLTAEFAVKIPGLATATGHRLLLPPAVFQAGYKYPFQTIQRTYPVYFESPFQRTDEVSIQLPPGYSVESLPPDKNETTSFGLYKIQYQKQAGELRLSRRFQLDGYYFPVAFYSALRVLFDKARAGDEQQAVLRLAQDAAQK